MKLLQFSTSHYCRKIRLILGYKQLNYTVENLTPGLHVFRIKPLTGLTTMPVLCLDSGESIGDSTAIWQYLEQQYPEHPLLLTDPALNRQILLLEDWLDESIGIATRFVYYDYRAGAGKHLDTSWLSPIVVNLVRQQYKIQGAAVVLARQRLAQALEILAPWQDRPYLVGDRLTLADFTAAALLTPLQIIPEYQDYTWLWQRVKAVHDACGEPFPQL